MKKIILFFLAILTGVIAFCGCATNNGNGSGNGGNIGGSGASNRKYITHFDGYTQCIVYPAVKWGYGNLYEGGTVINDWIVDPQYVKEGTGSIKVSMNEKASDGTYWYTGKICSKNHVSNWQDITGAKKISLDVYNPENKPLDVSIEIRSATQTMLSVKKTCTAGVWTTVNMGIPNGNYDLVAWYAIKLENTNQADKNQPFTVYMDNFYLEF